MTNHRALGSEAVAERERHQAHRLALLVGMLMAFTLMLGLVGCRAPAGDPEAVTEETSVEEPVEASTDADDEADEPRGLRMNSPEASPGYVFFNPNWSLTTYLVDLEGRVVHTW